MPEASKRYQRNQKKGSSSLSIDHGVDLDTLRSWKKDNYDRMQVEEDGVRQEIAIAKMKKYVIFSRNVIFIQSWARMLPHRNRFLMYMRNIGNIRYVFFRAWKVYVICSKRHLCTICKRPFKEWKDETKEQNRMQTIAILIFKRAFEKCCLSPQAILTFFNPIQHRRWRHQIDEVQLKSIRRMILQRLIDAWKEEVKFRRINRFRAYQVMKRVSRTKFEKSSEKEVSLIVFHMWYRLIAYKVATRHNEFPKMFSIPYIAEWSSALTTLTKKTMMARRTLDKAKLLIQLRAFRNWRLLKRQFTIPEFPEKLKMAEAHFVERLGKNVFNAWYYLSRERGRNLRRRNKLFSVWRIWAKNERKLRDREEIVCAFCKGKIKFHLFAIWSQRIQSLISTRTYSLRVLKNSIKSPKILLVVYCLLNKESHIIFLDCFSRWKLYRTRCMAWKAALLKLRSEYSTTIIRLIMDCWKKYTKTSKQRNNQDATDLNLSESLLGSYLLFSWNLLKKNESGSEQYLIKKMSINEFQFCCRAQVIYSRHLEKLELENQNPNTELSSFETLIHLGDLDGVMDCILKGQRVYMSHVRTAASFFGDNFIPILGLLLSCCVAFTAGRVVSNDVKLEVMRCTNPLIATLLGCHVDRWIKFDITKKEISTVCNDDAIKFAAGTNFQSLCHFRILTLLLIRLKSEQIQKECDELSALRVENNINLMVKKKKLLRFWGIELSIKSLFGLEDIELKSKVEKFVLFDNLILPVSSPVSVPHSLINTKVLEQFDQEDFGSLIREYLLLTGTLADEAKKFRAPLLYRDENLLKNAFIKQARLDYLILRESTGAPILKKNNDEEHLLTSKASSKKTRDIKLTPTKKNVIISTPGADVLKEIYSSFPPNTLIEVWWPALQSVIRDEDFSEVSANLSYHQISQRYAAINNDLRNRIVELILCSGFAMDPNFVDYQYCGVSLTNKSLGFNLIIALHQNPSYLSFFKLWHWWPRKWWHPVRLACLLAREINNLIQIEKKIEETIEVDQKQIKHKNLEQFRLTKYLKMCRSNVMSLGKKTGDENKKVKETRAKIIGFIDLSVIKAKKLKEKISSLKQLVMIIKLKLDENLLDDAVALLEKDCPLEESVIVTKEVVYEMINKVEYKILELCKILSSTEIALVSYQNDLQAFTNDSKSVKELLHAFSNEKLKESFDVQILLANTINTIKSFKDSVTKNTNTCQIMLDRIDDLNIITAIFLKKTLNIKYPDIEMSIPSKNVSKKVKQNNKKKKSASSKLVRFRSNIEHIDATEIEDLVHKIINDDIFRVSAFQKEHSELGSRRQGHVLESDENLTLTSAINDKIGILNYSIPQDSSPKSRAYKNITSAPNPPPPIGISDDLANETGLLSINDILNTDLVALVDSLSSKNTSRNASKNTSNKNTSRSSSKQFTLSGFVKRESLSLSKAISLNSTLLNGDFCTENESDPEDIVKLDALECAIRDAYWLLVLEKVNIQDVDSKERNAPENTAQKSTLIVPELNLFASKSSSAISSTDLIFEDPEDESFITRNMNPTQLLYHNIKKKMTKMSLNQRYKRKESDDEDTVRDRDDEYSIVNKLEQNEFELNNSFNSSDEVKDPKTIWKGSLNSSISLVEVHEHANRTKKKKLPRYSKKRVDKEIKECTSNEDQANKNGNEIKVNKQALDIKDEDPFSKIGRWYFNYKKQIFDEGSMFDDIVYADTSTVTNGDAVSRVHIEMTKLGFDNQVYEDHFVDLFTVELLQDFLTQMIINQIEEFILDSTFVELESDEEHDIYNPKFTVEQSHSNIVSSFTESSESLDEIQFPHQLNSQNIQEFDQIFSTRENACKTNTSDAISVNLNSDDKGNENDVERLEIISETVKDKSDAATNNNNNIECGHGLSFFLEKTHQIDTSDSIFVNVNSDDITANKDSDPEELDSIRRSQGASVAVLEEGKWMLRSIPTINPFQNNNEALSRNVILQRIDYKELLSVSGHSIFNQDIKNQPVCLPDFSNSNISDSMENNEKPMLDHYPPGWTVPGSPGGPKKNVERIMSLKDFVENGISKLRDDTNSFSSRSDLSHSSSIRDCISDSNDKQLSAFMNIKSVYIEATENNIYHKQNILMSNPTARPRKKSVFDNAKVLQQTNIDRRKNLFGYNKEFDAPIFKAGSTMQSENIDASCKPFLDNLSPLGMFSPISRGTRVKKRVSKLRDSLSKRESNLLSIQDNLKGDSIKKQLPSSLDSVEFLAGIKSGDFALIKQNSESIINDKKKSQNLNYQHKPMKRFQLNPLSNIQVNAISMTLSSKLVPFSFSNEDDLYSEYQIKNEEEEMDLDRAYAALLGLEEVSLSDTYNADIDDKINTFVDDASSLKKLSSEAFYENKISENRLKERTIDLSTKDTTISVSNSSREFQNIVRLSVEVYDDLSDDIDDTIDGIDDIDDELRMFIRSSKKTSNYETFSTKTPKEIASNSPSKVLSFSPDKASCDAFVLSGDSANMHVSLPQLPNLKVYNKTSPKIKNKSPSFALHSPIKKL